MKHYFTIRQADRWDFLAVALWAAIIVWFALFTGFSLPVLVVVLVASVLVLPAKVRIYLPLAFWRVDPNASVPGWYCGNVGCTSVGPHEHPFGVEKSLR